MRVLVGFGKVEADKKDEGTVDLCNLLHKLFFLLDSLVIPSVRKLSELSCHLGVVHSNRRSDKKVGVMNKYIENKLQTLSLYVSALGIHFHFSFNLISSSF